MLLGILLSLTLCKRGLNQCILYIPLLVLLINFKLYINNPPFNLITTTFFKAQVFIFYYKSIYESRNIFLIFLLFSNHVIFKSWLITGYYKFLNEFTIFILHRKLKIHLYPTSSSSCDTACLRIYARLLILLPI